MKSGPTDDMVQSAQRVIIELLRAQRFFWFYPENHPASTDLIKNLWAQMMELLSDTPMNFTITKDSLSLGAIPMDIRKQNNHEFCRILNKRRIQQLTIYPTATLDEFRIFVHSLSLEPRKLRQKGGMSKILKDAGIKNIVLAEFLYDSGDLGTGEYSSEGTSEYLSNLTDAHIQRFKSFLRGDIKELSSSEEELFFEYLQNSDRTMELIRQSSLNASVTTETAFNEKDFRQGITRIRKWLDEFTPDKKNQMLRKLAAGFFNQDMESQKKMISSPRGLSPDEEETFRQMVQLIPDDELVEHLIRMVPEQSDRVEIGEMLKQYLVDPLRAEILIDKFDALMTHQKLALDDEAQLIKFHERLKGYNHEEIVRDCLIVILSILETERNETVIKNGFNTLDRIFPELLSSNQFKLCEDMLMTLNTFTQRYGDTHPEIANLTREVFSRLSSKDFIEKIRNSLSELKPENEASLATILTYMDESGLDVLVSRIMDKTSPDIQAKFINVLKRLKDRIIPQIMILLKTGGTENGKTWLDVLESIGTEEVARALVINYDLLPNVLHQRALNIIGNSALPENRDWLIRLFQMNISHEISMECLEALVKIGDSESVQFLVKCSEKAASSKQNDRAIQYKSIQLLGKLDRPELIPNLMNMIRKRYWFNTNHVQQMRLNAAQALYRMNAPEALDALKSGCQDKRKAVSRMCNGFLMMKTSSTGKGDN